MTPILRTRFAPSPTGELHLGNARAALFAWLLARGSGGRMVLRIEDTDRERSKPEFEEAIRRDLTWLGLDWDEGPDVGGDYGPYRQSERSGAHRKSVETLREKGCVYPCFCTKDELEAMRVEAQKKGVNSNYDGRCRRIAPEEAERRIQAGEPFAWRFRTPDGETFTVRDLIRGEIRFRAEDIGDFVVARSDGSPLFLLTNLVDDLEMAITHVVRGEDHLSNTPRQIMMARALGKELPAYAHATLILGKDRKKFSKRHGAASVGALREEGYVAPAVTNYLALLGWSPKDDREFFTLDELKAAFSIEAVSKAAAVFDFDKLKWMNGHYVRKMDKAELAARAAEEFRKAGFIEGDPPPELVEKIPRMVEFAGDRLKLISDVAECWDFYFRDVEEYEEKAAKKAFGAPEAAADLQAVRNAIAAMNEEEFLHEKIEAALRAIAESRGVSLGRLNHPARLALTGRATGPGLFELMEILDRERCMERIDRAIKYINGEQMPINNKQPLAEVFGFLTVDQSEKANRYRSRRLCPFNNKVPNCTKNSAINPLGECSIFHQNAPVITCPIRFREDWIITEDAASFFFKESEKWSSLIEVRLDDSYGKPFGKIDIVLAAYDADGKVYDFGALEIQDIYISRNVIDSSEHYIEGALYRDITDWPKEPKKPHSNFLEKMLAPQFLFKSGIRDILNNWNKKIAIAINKPFFDTLPKLKQVKKQDADIALFVYDLELKAGSRERRYFLTKKDEVFTKFEPALFSIRKSTHDYTQNFMALLQEKFDERLETPP